MPFRSYDCSITQSLSVSEAAKGRGQKSTVVSQNCVLTFLSSH